MADRTHAVKIRRTGEKAWTFLGRDGTSNRLRVHAVAMSAEAASEVADRLPLDNPGWEARAVTL